MNRWMQWMMALQKSEGPRGKRMSRPAAGKAATETTPQPASKSVLVALFWLACFAAPIAMLCLQAYLGNTYPFAPNPS